MRRRLDSVGATPAAPSTPTVFAKLTPRQREIATLVAQGRSNQEIADQLFLSVHTVRNQLVAIFDLLGISRRAEIAALVARRIRDGQGRRRDSCTCLTGSPDVVS